MNNPFQIRSAAPTVQNAVPQVDPKHKAYASGINAKDYARLKKAAVEFEAILLQHILKSSKGKMSRSMFGGGMAEEFFQDHLIELQAKSLAERQTGSGQSGFGISEMILNDILKKSNKGVKISDQYAERLNDRFRALDASKSYK